MTGFPVIIQTVISPHTILSTQLPTSVGLKVNEAQPKLDLAGYEVQGGPDGRQGTEWQK